jgi:hypothetical protein
VGLIGRLEDLALPDIFQILSLSKKTGKLTLTRREGSGVIIFKEGLVIYAASDSVRDTLGNILVCQKHLTENALMAVLEIQHRSPDGKDLGIILVEKGFATPEVLEHAVRHQVERVIFELLTWETGFFRFDILDIKNAEDIQVETKDFLCKAGINPQYLVLEGMRHLDEMRKSAPPAPSAPSALSAPSAPPREVVQPPTLSAKVFTSLKGLLKEALSPAFTGEITLNIMRYAVEVTTRGVLLVLRRDGINGFGQFGVDIGTGSPDERVRSIKIPLAESSIFTEVVERRETYRGKVGPGKWNDYFLEHLGGKRPEEAVIIPMTVAGKVVVIFYGDDAGSGKPLGDIEGLELLTAQASLAMEKSILEKKLQTFEAQVQHKPT